MHNQPNPDEVARLAKAFSTAQRLAPSEDCLAVAKKLASASPQIWQAAMYWLVRGEMPAQPVMHGYSPRSFVGKKGLVPSAALTALMALEQDPSAALISLKHVSPRGRRSFR